MHNVIDLWTALKYPYAFGNLRRGWLFPSVCLVLVQIVTLLCVQYLPDLTLLKTDDVAIKLADLLQFLLLTGSNVLLCGFLWSMTGNLQDNGKQVAILLWREHWGCYLLRGFKLLLLASLLASFLVFLTQKLVGQLGGSSLLTMGLLTILYTVAGFFLLVVIVDASRNYRFRELLLLHRGLGCIGAYFVPWLMACLYAVLALALYLLVLMVAGMLFGMMIDSIELFDMLVFPFALVPLIITIWHLLNQPFLPDAEEASEEITEQ